MSIKNRLEKEFEKRTGFSTIQMAKELENKLQKLDMMLLEIEVIKKRLENIEELIKNG